MKNELTTKEKYELQKCEVVIERGLSSFIDVGNALLKIRDGKLYRQEFKTFEQYCQKKWNIERAHAYRLMDGAIVVANLSPFGDKPTNLEQTRSLAPLDPEDQIKVWQEVLEEKPDGNVTAKVVEKFVDKFQSDKKISKALEDLGDISISDLADPHLGDMREIGKSIQDNSIDLVITDPPYPGEFIECWSWLSELASRVLKPSGFLFAYSGQLHLPEVLHRLSENLVYYWTMDLLHSGGNQLIMPRNIFCGWKPILIFQKPPFKMFPDQFADTIQGSGREKESHNWQQSESELDIIIEKFTLPGEIILDPFMGSGTTIVASINKKRRAIGIEIDKNTYLVARKRISDEQ